MKINRVALLSILFNLFAKRKVASVVRTTLCLVLLASPVFADSFGMCAYDFTDTVKSEMGSYIGVALGLTVLLIAFAFMLGSMTSNPQFIVFYKDELYHLMFSVILLVGLSSIFYLSCVTFRSFLDFAFVQLGLGNSECYKDISSVQDIAGCYFTRLISNVRSFASSAIRGSIQNEMDSTKIIGVSNPVTGGVYLPWNAYKRTYAMQLDMVATMFAIPALVSITMQKILVSFSNDFVRWILPIAFFLRVLPPARQMGNILIALSLAFYIIIPVFYALNGAMDEAVFKDCSAYNDVIKDTVMGDCTNSNTNFWMAARAIPQAYFLPNLTLAILITFLAGINKALKVIT
jgi:hypothetical protein